MNEPSIFDLTSYDPVTFWVTIVGIVVVFDLVFVGFWCLVVYGIGACGWSSLGQTFPVRFGGVPDSAERLPMSLMLVNGASYKGGAAQLLFDRGPGFVYLRPSWIFRVNHPTVRLPVTALQRGSGSPMTRRGQTLVPIEVRHLAQTWNLWLPVDVVEQLGLDV